MLAYFKNNHYLCIRNKTSNNTKIKSVMTTFTFYFVDNNDCDIQTKHYDFNNLNEAIQHAKKLLAVDMMNTDHIEISSPEVTRHIVNYLHK